MNVLLTQIVIPAQAGIHPLVGISTIGWMGPCLRRDDLSKNCGVLNTLVVNTYAYQL